MKPKKRTLTSKALTLRLVCAALVMVFLACILGFYTPFPTQVIDQSEKEFSTGPTEALEQHWFGTTSAYLLGSECILRRPAAAGAVTNGSRAPLTAVVL